MEILGDLFRAPELRATSSSSGRSSSRRSSRTSTTAGRNVNIDDRVAHAGLGRAPARASRSPGRSPTCARFTTRDVRAHFRAFYGAANMVLCRGRPDPAGATVARAGRVRRSPACRAAQRREPLRAAAARRAGRASARSTTSRRRRRCTSCSTALPETDPDYMALRALVRVLDDGMSTRLHYQICDQKGLAYSVAGSCTRTTTPRCWRSTPPARTRSSRRWSTEALAHARALPRRAGRRGRAGKGQAPLRQRHRGLATTTSTACAGWFGGTELFMRAAPAGEARARRSTRVTPRGHPRVARRVIRARAPVGDRRSGALSAEAHAAGEADRPRLPQ